MGQLKELGLEGASEEAKRSNPSRLMLHPAFHETLSALKRVNVVLPSTPVPDEPKYGHSDMPKQGTKMECLESSGPHKLSALAGQMIVEGNPLIAAYDESINKFSALEGTAYITSHSLVTMAPNHYIPANMLTFYFYTRSADVKRDSDVIRHSDNPSYDSEIDYVKDKISLIASEVPDGSLLFVDGPLIAGDSYTTFISSIKDMHSRDIIPVFFVKNSESNLITDNMPELRSRYNCDLHWAHRTLKSGERSALYKYSDRHVARNAKVFCYLKSYDVSPVRVEFHLETYEVFRGKIPSILDVVHYLLLVQGDRTNPQPRPIAVAEMYARDTLKLVNLESIMRRTGFVPTMNQERFAW